MIAALRHLDEPCPAPITRGRRRVPHFVGGRASAGLRGGFTLIELLTVITILAILATLLLTTLGSVKRKAREAVCISNLHQIGLAMNLYLEDFGKRPPDLETLVVAKYLTPKVLLCPADKTGSRTASVAQPDFMNGTPPQLGNASPMPHVSYQHPLAWPDEEWNRLMQASTRAGIVACTFHDVRPRQDATFALASDGLILRGLLDGTVVRRQVFPEQAETESGTPTERGAPPPTTSFADVAVGGAADKVNQDGTGNALDSAYPPWGFFSDDPAP